VNLPPSLFAAVRIPRFAAQALSAARPELRGRPFVVVEQDPESHKTTVLDLSPSAAAEGEFRHIWPGLPAFLVRRKWAELPVMARDIKAETKLRAALDALWLCATPAFASEGGKVLLDLAGTPLARRHMKRERDEEESMRRLGEALHAAVRALGMEQAAVGVAATRVAARMLAKVVQSHDGSGSAACPSGSETDRFDSLSPDYLPGLSPAARARLKKYGLVAIAAVRVLDREELRLRFGLEGDRLHALARGLDFGPAIEKRRPVEVETVFPRDLNDEEVLRNRARLTADKLCHALRAEGLKANRFTLTLVYSDGRSARRTLALNPPTAAFEALAARVVPLFFELYQRRVALRRIRLGVAVPAPETGQRDLFEDALSGKQEALSRAIDAIRRKRGFTDVVSASNVEKGKKIVTKAPNSGPSRAASPRAATH
jgi:nucleotidyltransferase/DNA polymerase involved in DNA repair